MVRQEGTGKQRVLLVSIINHTNTTLMHSIPSFNFPLSSLSRYGELLSEWRGCLMLVIPVRGRGVQWHHYKGR